MKGELVEAARGDSPLWRVKGSPIWAISYMKRGPDLFDR